MVFKKLPVSMVQGHKAYEYHSTQQKKYLAFCQMIEININNYIHIIYIYTYIHMCIKFIVRLINLER